MSNDPLDSALTDLSDVPDEAGVLAAASLGRATLHARTFREMAEPDHVYYLQTANEVKRIEAAPKSHNESLLSPAALAGFVQRYKGEDSAIFLGRERIVYISNIGDRRDRATVTLGFSEQFKALKQAMAGVGHKEFIRLLKIGLRDAIADPKLRSAVETVKFESSETGESNVGHTHQGMSMSVQKQLSGVGEIPEEVVVRLSIYEDVEHPVQITCAVEVDPFAKKFALTPLPAQLQTAFDVTFEVIETQLEPAGLPIWRGNP